MNVSLDQIRTDIVESLATLTGLEASGIRDQDRLLEDMGLDSLQSMELLTGITDKYNLDLELEEIMEIETVGALITELHKFIQAA